MRYVSSLMFCLSMSVSAAQAAPQLSKAWSLSGFEQPESVVALPDRAGYVVSNIQGHPGEADGQGYLSLVSRDGKMLKQHWVTGMDAPKGIAIHKGRMFVTDLTRLHIVDVASGKILTSLSAEDAVFLNDVTTDDSGDAYISDMMTGQIFRYADGVLETWLSVAEIPHPNGVHWNGQSLVIGNWGHEIQDDFSTLKPGSLFAVDIETKQVSPISTSAALGNVDGVESVEGGYFSSDWIAGRLLFSEGEKTVEVLDTEAGSADIGVDGRRVMVPMMSHGRVDVYSW